MFHYVTVNSASLFPSKNTEPTQCKHIKIQEENIFFRCCTQHIKGLQGKSDNGTKIITFVFVRFFFSASYSLSDKWWRQRICEKFHVVCVAWNKNLMHAINSNLCWRSCTRLPVYLQKWTVLSPIFLSFFQVIRFIWLAHGRRLSECSTGLKGTWVLAGWLACSSHVLPLRYWPGNNQFQDEEAPLITCVRPARLSSSILCRFSGAFLVSALAFPSQWPHAGRRVRSRFAEMTMIVGVRRQPWFLWGKSRVRLQHLWWFSWRG